MAYINTNFKSLKVKYSNNILDLSQNLVSCYQNQLSPVILLIRNADSALVQYLSG